MNNLSRMLVSSYATKRKKRKTEKLWVQCTKCTEYPKCLFFSCTMVIRVKNGIHSLWKDLLCNSKCAVAKITYDERFQLSSVLTFKNVFVPNFLLIRSAKMYSLLSWVGANIQVLVRDRGSGQKSDPLSELLASAFRDQWSHLKSFL